MIPVPDPTVLTTEALEREIKHLREVVQIQLDAAEKIRLEQKQDQKEALESALTAQKAVCQEPD